MNEYTIENNKISQFILRIDLQKQATVDFQRLASDLEPLYLRLVKSIQHNLNVNMDTEELTARDFENFVLHTDSNVQLKLLSLEKAIILETSTYIDNSVYVERLSDIIEKINQQEIGEVKASRIGMRYINTFPCNHKNSIKKILQSPCDKAIIGSINKENLSRSIFVEQYNCGDYYVRVQYGVPNKFYPSVIRNYDLTLDIDVYNSCLTPIGEWQEVVKNFNHAAYDKFCEYIREEYINSMRNE